jgi:tripartite-type tricarboxylate transporter receptor subunit TctC
MLRIGKYKSGSFSGKFAAGAASGAAYNIRKGAAMVTRRRFLASSAAALAAGAAGPLGAQTAQTSAKNTRIIMGYPAGGSADLVARHIAERLRGTYAPSVIVENRVGALQAIPIQALLAADPDGSTLYYAPHSIVSLYPHVYRNLPYDPARDLVPVSVVCSLEFALAVAPNVPARTLREFIDWCKADPKNAVYGSLGHGTAFHFLGFMLSQAAGVTLTHVPYKGAAPAVQALVGGQVPSMIGPIGDLLPHQASGRARILATSGAQRSVHTPDVPTFEEAGYKGVTGKERFGFFVRRGTPGAIVEGASRAVATALQQADLRAAIEKLGYNEPRGSTPQEFEAFIKADYAHWQSVVKASGFTPGD